MEHSADTVHVLMWIITTLLTAFTAFIFTYLLHLKNLRSDKFDKLVDALSGLYFKVSILQGDKYHNLLNEVYTFKKANKDNIEENNSIFISKKLGEYLQKLFELADYAGTIDNISRFYFDNLAYSQPILDKHGEYGQQIVKLFGLLSNYNIDDADSVKNNAINQQIDLLNKLENETKDTAGKYREHLDNEHRKYLSVFYFICKRLIKKLPC